MPDNVTLPGTGASIATDEVDDGAGLRQFQLVKLAHGVDGAAALVSSASGLPVQGVGELMEAIEALRMTVQSLARTVGQVMPDTAGRQRVLLDAITGSLTLGTVTTVSQVGGVAASDQVPALMRIAADALRGKITVT
jgi:hypothetical protein